jgi:hypothetical protein
LVPWRSLRLCVCAPRLSWRRDCHRKRESDFEALREEHFLRYGEVITGPGMEYVHLPPDHPERVRDATERRIKYGAAVVARCAVGVC